MPRPLFTERKPAGLLAQLAEPFTGEALFDCLNDLVFFIKNARGEYVVVNQELAARCGRRAKRDVIGRRADEIYPAPLGQGYRIQDEEVLRTGRPILNRLELQLGHSGRRTWCITNKLPLRGADGRVVGLVGISRDLPAPREKPEDYARAALAIRHIQACFDEPLLVTRLAALAGLSPYQFRERIRRLFNLTAGQFILKVRMDEAVRRLRETGHPVADVALACGYSDQSAFTRQFRRTVGISPAQFRRAARAGTA